MRLLMVEESAAYAALVRAQLADASAGEVRVRHVPTLQAALEAVRATVRAVAAGRRGPGALLDAVA